MKVVIDCNVFVSCLSELSICNEVLQALYRGQYKLILSTEIYFEYHEVFHQKFKKEVATVFLEALDISPFVAAYIPFYSWNLIASDPDDNKYADIYIASSADYLVTNDHHFNVLKHIEFPKINVINIATFLEILTHK